MYIHMKLPGSYLYSEAKNKGEDLPLSYEEFAFLSYDSKPSGTNQLSNKRSHSL